MFILSVFPSKKFESRVQGRAGSTGSGSKNTTASLAYFRQDT